MAFRSLYRSQRTQTFFCVQIYYFDYFHTMCSRNSIENAIVYWAVGKRKEVLSNKRITINYWKGIEKMHKLKELNKETKKRAATKTSNSNRNRKRKWLAKCNFSKKLLDKSRNLSENVTTIISATTNSNIIARQKVAPGRAAQNKRITYLVWGWLGVVVRV